MQWTKKLTALLKYIVIAYIVLTPQRNYSQFSDSTIHEINKRLIECIECREKQALYIQLAHKDSISLHKQATIITNQEKTIAKEKSKNKILRNVNAVQFALFILALIL
jgi:hypothetical protein